MRTQQRRRGPLLAGLGIVVAFWATFAVVGCGDLQRQVGQQSVTTVAPGPETIVEITTTTGSSPTTTTLPVETTTEPPSTSTSLTTTTTSEATTTTSAPQPAAGLSAKSIAYAKSLGGKSHLGETLYFVMGASKKTEKEAQAALDNAAFGDVQMYFIVQKSDNFEGMKPGWWVVFEARRTEPTTSDWDFYRVSFPDAYVRQATVRTSDPIPVYEDLVSGAE